MKKLLILCIGILFISGCSKSIDTMTENLSKVIVDANQVENPSSFGLNSEEKELLEDYFDSQARNRKIINIDNSVGFSEESYTKEPNTAGIFEKNGKHYIKYNELKWKKTYDGDDEYAVINLDGLQSALYKSLVPLLYEETHGKSKYNYEFGESKEFDNLIKYYYKSIYDDSGFVIEYTIDDNKIVSIDTYYQDVYYVD